MTNRKGLAGFSLVEMAIVILIAGILMSAGLGLLKVKRDAAQAEATIKHQEVIKQALINYLGQNKRLPCPADPTVKPISGKEDRNTVGANPPCNRYSGVVPYIELGLDRITALDGWENFITYVVSPPVVVPATPTSTAWLYSFSTTINDSSHNPGNNPPTIPNSAFWPSTSTGGITVRDTLTNVVSPIADPTKGTGAAVALISYGKNGYGATNINGTNANGLPPATNPDEVNNFNPFNVTTQPIVVKRDTTDSTTAIGGPFDDILMTLSAQDLVGPLVANGTLQANAVAALEQANNEVIGAILVTKSSCGSCYNIPAIITLASSNAVAWGVQYKQLTTSVSATTTPPTNTAYTLTAGDGSTRTVSIGELQGILNHTGF